MKKFAALLLALCLLLAGCGEETPAATETEGEFTHTTVGILLPGNEESQWADRGKALTRELEMLGYHVSVAYADGDPQLQEDQLEKLVLRGADCLVVTAVDSLTLTDAVAYAKASSVPVVAYDRLLMHTDGVSWHVAFDSRAAGETMGNHIAQKYQLEEAARQGNSYTVEFFMGSPEDTNSQLIYQGIMAVLQPYLDSGALVCRTGRVRLEDNCVQDWSGKAARWRYEQYCSQLYDRQVPDILCCASDSIAEGLIGLLEDRNWSGEKWPLITGQGGGETAQQRVAQGKQSMTLTADYDELAEQCALGVHALLTGKNPQVTDASSCYNGVTIVPACLWPMPLITE